MGCNQSKNDDIKNDNEARQRNTASSSQNAGNPSQTPSKQIGVPSKENEEPQEVSYSLMREQDNDFFKGIIDRTAQKFIDVSMVGPDGKEYVGERDYSNQIKGSTITKPSGLTSLPRLSAACSTSNLQNLLSQPTPIDNDISKYTSNIVDALNNVNIKDCGELVVSFANSLK
ncbi:hypothetical protein CYY_007869 [Polysphondylium violaceum]|uniref:Lipoprotein n=1 Tax=Polysphondylium violaceum TaxID=133409 RepID=A0A8J4PPN2_9MYCE|nr:hypothetical protein CYY_007869 [Polysphondylium violaceum]